MGKKRKSGDILQQICGVRSDTGNVTFEKKSHQKSFTHRAGNRYGTGSVGNIDWPFNMNDFFAVMVTKRDQIPTLLVTTFSLQIASGERRHAGDT